MTRHYRRPWRHYDDAPLVYVDTRFDYPATYRCDPSRPFSPDVLAGRWSRPGDVRPVGPPRHRQRRRDAGTSFAIVSGLVIGRR